MLFSCSFAATASSTIVGTLRRLCWWIFLFFLCYTKFSCALFLCRRLLTGVETRRGTGRGGRHHGALSPPAPLSQVSGPAREAHATARSSSSQVRNHGGLSIFTLRSHSNIPTNKDKQMIIYAATNRHCHLLSLRPFVSSHTTKSKRRRLVQ